MADCPLILKRKKPQGISLTELLIVVAVIAVLILALIAAFKPWTQQAKARDAQRKADLQKIKAPLEDYYNDNNCYPYPTLDDLVPDYIGEKPTDPETGEDYIYIPDPNCNFYQIYTRLEYINDPEIIEVGCGAGCGPGGDDGTCEYNYGISGGGESLECCTAPEDICPFGGRPWVAPPDCENPGDYCGKPTCCYQNWVMVCDGEEYWCCQPEE